MMDTSFFKNIKLSYKIRKILSRWSSINTIVLFFVIFFLTILKTLFSYTVMDYDYYNWLADSQQIWKVSVPVNRWTILSGWEKTTVLGTSLHLYDLAVDPQIEWDKQKLSDFLVDVIYNELCLNKKEFVCKSNLLKYLRVLDIENFQTDDKFIKDLLRERIISRLVQTKVTSVMIDKELTSFEINQIKNLGISWLYPWDKYLYINPEEFNNSDDNIKELSKIIWTNEERLKNLTRKRDLRYIWIINKLSITSSEYIFNYIKDEKEAITRGILSKDKSINWFFILNPLPSRYYPEWNLGSQVIWFVDSAWKWNYWLEWYFNDILKWNNWEIISRKDINGRIIDPISLNQEDLIWEWIEIVTTIALSALISLLINKGYDWAKSIIAPTRQQALANSSRLLRKAQMKKNIEVSTRLSKLISILSSMNDDQYIMAKHQMGMKNLHNFKPVGKWNDFWL